MGAKPPKILENHDKFVSENKSGNKGMSILRYFDLGWNHCSLQFKNGQSLTIQLYFGGEAPENFRKSWLIRLRESGNKGTTIFCYFVLGQSPQIFRYCRQAGCRLQFWND